MLRGLKATTGQRKHLFPSRDSRNTPMCIARARAPGRISVLGWAGTYSPMPPTTGSTRLSEMGYRARYHQKAQPRAL